MNYKGYEFQFSTAIHIGKRKLEDSEKTLFADTLFSAMCHEALAQGGEKLLKNFVSRAINREIMITDTFPYYEGNQKRYYVPKPIMRIETEDKGNSNIKKDIKKLDYIPFELIDEYLSGKLDAKKEVAIYKHIGEDEIRTMAATSENEDTLPFSVGTFKFHENWGLYTIIGYETEEAAELAEKLFLGLEYSGIGGKRNAGLGKFELRDAKLPKKMLESLRTDECKNGKYMALTVSMAEEARLSEIMEDATYSIIRRGGFISSETFTDRAVKKKDSFLFKSGSVFTQTFNGIIDDVSLGGSHPVYRYSNPIFLEVR